MNKKKGILLTILSAVTFGFAFTLGPMTYGDGGSNPVTLTLLRNLLSLPLLLGILLVKRTSLKVTKQELMKLAILGVIGNAITTLMLNISFSMIDVGIATTIHFVYPVFVTIGCVLFFKEKLALQKVIALLIATSGIACFFFAGGSSSEAGQNMMLGLFFAIASGVTYAFYIIFMDKSGLKSHDPFKVSFYVAIFATIGMLMYGSVVGQLTLGTLTAKSWGISFVFAFLCTVVGLSLLQIGIKNVGASTAAVLTTFEPITSVTFGVILLGEELTIIKVIACILILIGVVTLALAKDKEAALKNKELIPQPQNLAK